MPKNLSLIEIYNQIQGVADVAVVVKLLNYVSPSQESACDEESIFFKVRLFVFVNLLYFLHTFDNDNPIQVNFASLTEFNTIEFRQYYEGTVFSRCVIACSDAEVRFWTEVRTWTSWTKPKVRFKVQSFCWTGPKVQLKVQPVIERFEPEPNLGLKLAGNPLIFPEF